MAIFWPNGVAKQGDRGSDVLPKGPAAEVWTAGTAVEVAWGIRYNHGGGSVTPPPPPPHIFLYFLSLSRLP